MSDPDDNRRERETALAAVVLVAYRRAMGRELRPLIADGIYHVYCRGVRRTNLYRSPVDFEQFLFLLETLSGAAPGAASRTA